jgi:hypothetical protein
MQTQLSLHEEMIRAVQSSMHDGSVRILNFRNHYTSILASACPNADVHIYNPIIENVNHDELNIWCDGKGYNYHPICVSLKDARDLAIEKKQVSLLNVAMHMVSEQVDNWIGVPEEIRIIATDSGWKIVKPKSLLLWEEDRESAYIMRSAPLMLAYLKHTTITSLVTGKMPGKKSNRSSDRSIWTDFDTTVIPYHFHLALRPLWEHYQGEVVCKNEARIEQEIVSYQEMVEMLENA